MTNTRAATQLTVAADANRCVPSIQVSYHSVVAAWQNHRPLASLERQMLLVIIRERYDLRAAPSPVSLSLLG